jgi:ATP-binding cassette, subfamily B, bacterial
MSAQRTTSDLNLYRRLLWEAYEFWPHIVALFALTLLSTPLTLLNPLPLKILVDSVLGSQEVPSWLAFLLPANSKNTDDILILIVAGFFISLALGKHVIELLFVVLRTYTAEQLLLVFRAKLFAHLQRLALSYHDSSSTSSSIYRIQYDAQAIQWILIDGFIPLVSSLLTLAAMIVVVARIDWSLALVALTAMPIVYALLQWCSRRLKSQWREAKNLENAMLSVVGEVISSVRLVKAFVQEQREQVTLTVTSGIFSFVIGLAMAFGTAIVLFLGVSHVQSGQITLGELILVMSYVALLYAPLQTVSKTAASLQGSLVGAERSFQLLDQPLEVPEKPSARHLVRARGEIEFENVSFLYNAERRALREVCFQIVAGAHVGIAGRTGAGKSTLINLLLRFYDPSEGRILLDGVDIREYRLSDLRNQFAVVQQEPVLFSSSVAENIAYARQGANEMEVIAAAEAANADDFIKQLPQGYATQVGERGVQLSGGERQRISLARAFLKDAPILVFDEPTSSVDLATEAAILEAMKRLMRGRTTFMIAHRLETLKTCDVSLVLQRGEVEMFTSSSSNVSREHAILTGKLRCARL